MTEGSLQERLDGVLGTPKAQYVVNERVHAVPIAEEGGRPRVLQDIEKKRRASPSGELHTHVGFAGWFNLEAIAAGRHRYAVLLDANEAQAGFWQKIIGLLTQAPTPKLFEEGIRKEIYLKDITADGGEIFGIPARKTKLVYEYLRDAPWIKDGDLYAHLQDMAKHGRILTAQCNVFDYDRLESIRRFMDEAGLKVDTVYASNIKDFSKPSLNRRIARETFPARSLSEVIRQPLEELEARGIASTQAQPCFYNRKYPNQQWGIGTGLLANDENTTVYHLTANTCPPPFLEHGKQPATMAELVAKREVSRGR